MFFKNKGDYFKVLMECWSYITTKGKKYLMNDLSELRTVDELFDKFFI